VLGDHTSIAMAATTTDTTVTRNEENAHMPALFRRTVIAHRFLLSIIDCVIFG
jgi:hypothetical protein